MGLPAKTLFTAAALSFAVTAGAVHARAGILEIILGVVGQIDLIGDVEADVEEPDGYAGVNAEVIKGNVEAGRVKQRVSRRNVTAGGRSVQNYAVIVGGK